MRNKDFIKKDILDSIENILSRIDSFEISYQIKILNAIKQKLHNNSPFKNEPVDCVIWVKNDKVVANDYNPNSVAPPEMKLLQVSIENDGYTQPIVTMPFEGNREVIDGFHRCRVGKECKAVKEKVLGYLPVVTINSDRMDKGDRIASTIRHNRARGKHRIGSMSEIVVDLKRRNWSPAKIEKELGMDRDEILRLSQISGITEIFKDREFSKAWEADFILENTEIVNEDIEG